MKDKHTGNDLKKYSEDIATIKSMLMKIEQQPLMETWAFFSWGILVLLGSLLHFVLIKTTDWDLIQILFRVWIPLVGLASILESFAFFKRMNRDELPLFSRDAMRLWLSMFAMLIGMCIIIYLLFDLGYTRYAAIFIAILCGIMLLLYALMSNINIFVCSYLILLGSIVQYQFKLDVHTNFIVAGIYVGITFTLAGILVFMQQRKKADEQ